MLRTFYLSDAVRLDGELQARVYVEITYEDMDARELVKGLGFRWDRMSRRWETAYMTRDAVSELVRQLVDEGWAVAANIFLDTAASMLQFARIIDTPVPVVIGLQSEAAAWEHTDTPRYAFEPGETFRRGALVYQHGTVTRKNYRVR